VYYVEVSDQFHIPAVYNAVRWGGTWVPYIYIYIYIYIYTKQSVTRRLVCTLTIRGKCLAIAGN